jgi:hypothetical protein
MSQVQATGIHPAKALGCHANWPTQDQLSHRGSSYCPYFASECRHAKIQAFKGLSQLSNAIPIS